MDYRNASPRRPVDNGAGVRPQPAPAPQAQATRTALAKRRRGFGGAKVLYAVIAVIVLLAAAAAYKLLFATSLNQPASDRYQVVAMTSGQVYFGKVASIGPDFIELKNVYTAQAQDLPADATAEQKAAVKNNTSLVKVTNQVYGPEDTMMLRTDNVLFWQNLNKDSKVSTAIDKSDQ